MAARATRRDRHYDNASGSRVGHSIGAAVVKAWADAFPPGATVLDLGAGPGEPSTRAMGAGVSSRRPAHLLPLAQ